VQTQFLYGIGGFLTGFWRGFIFYSFCEFLIFALKFDAIK